METSIRTRPSGSRARGGSFELVTPVLISAPRPARRNEPPRRRPAVTIELLGGLRIRPDRADAIELGGVPAQVVKLVALRRRAHIEEVVEVVWPGLDPVVGRRRMRNVLTRIRNGAGAVIVRDGDLLVLGGDVDVDVHRFEAAAAGVYGAAGDPDAAEGSAREAKALYRGELLPADRFQDWTVAPRERLRRRYLAVVDHLARVAATRGQLEDALELVELALELEPHAEERYLFASEVLLGAGRRGAAAMMLRRADAALTELGLGRTDQHRRLAERLRTG